MRDRCSSAVVPGPGQHRLGEAVRARSNFAVVRTMQDGASEMFAVGKYLDRVVFEDDAPRFADRRVVLESHRIDILLVFPL